MKHLDQNEWLQRLQNRQYPVRDSYRAMYSTWWDGIVTDPALMIIPFDDHQVHRGDGVFEAVKVVNGRAWLLTEHLDRWEASAKSIAMTPPKTRAEMENIIRETLEVSGLKEAILRLFLSRGPGSFTTNPYDSVGAQVHLIVTDLKPLPAAKVEAGVSLGLSAIAPKDPWMARIKSCNYLANVLMKKEAVDRGFDFTVGIDGQGHLTEGSTENVFLLNADNVLVHPRLDGILAGTTMKRAFDLAKVLQSEGLIAGTQARDLILEDLLHAREVMMAGTTLDVISVTSYEGKPLAGGKPGPIATRLRSLVLADQ